MSSGAVRSQDYYDGYSAGMEDLLSTLRAWATLSTIQAVDLKVLYLHKSAIGTYLAIEDALDSR